MDHTKADGVPRRNSLDGVYEIFIVALTLFSLTMLLARYLPPLSEASRRSLLWLDIPISLIFMADSFRSLRRAPDKRAFLKWGWLDFVGSIPLILPLRIARLGRMIRALRNLRARRPKDVGKDLDHNRAEGAALLMLLLAVIVLSVATVMVLEAESRVPEANIQTGDDALWWALVTMATVGYGEYHPVTVWGRVGAVALMTVGIGIFGVLATYMASLFLPKSSNDEVTADVAAIRSDLAVLDRRLDAIEGALSNLKPPPPGDHDAEVN